MSAAGYDPVESLGREHNEIARLKARIAELEEMVDGGAEIKRLRARVADLEALIEEASRYVHQTAARQGFVEGSPTVDLLRRCYAVLKKPVDFESQMTRNRDYWRDKYYDLLRDKDER